MIDSKTRCLLIEFPETDCKPELIIIRNMSVHTEKTCQMIREAIGEMNALSLDNRLDKLDYFLDRLQLLFGDTLEVQPLTEIIEIK